METAAGRAQVDENQRNFQARELVRAGLLRDLDASVIEPIRICIEKWPNARPISVNHFLKGSAINLPPSFFHTLSSAGLITPENQSTVLGMSLMGFLAEIEEVKRRLDGIYDVTDIGQLDEEVPNTTSVSEVQTEQGAQAADVLREIDSKERVRAEARLRSPEDKELEDQIEGALKELLPDDLSPKK